MAGDRGGILFHVGEYQQRDFLRHMLSRDNPPLYDELVHYSTIYEAVDALKKLSKEKLESIRTFVIENFVDTIDARPQRETLERELLGDLPALERKMSAVFLAGKIKEGAIPSKAGC